MYMFDPLYMFVNIVFNVGNIALFMNRINYTLRPLIGEIPKIQNRIKQVTQMRRQNINTLDKVFI